MGDDDHTNFFGPRRRYDASTNIMVAAIVLLSFVVFLVALLHVYARCVLRRQSRRRGNRVTVVSGGGASTLQLPTSGLDPAVLAVLPAFVYKSANNETECSVCLSLLEDGEIARTLPNCKHTFHVNCIDQWFAANSTCPVCRTEAEPRLVAEPREGVALPPTAPPQPPELEVGKTGGSGSRLSSFRRILSRERSSRTVGSCGQDGDLERQ